MFTHSIATIPWIRCLGLTKVNHDQPSTDDACHNRSGDFRTIRSTSHQNQNFSDSWRICSFAASPSFVF